MKILIKIVLGLFALTVVSVAGAAVYLAYFFDANSYKQEIVDAAESATGRKLSIPGDINLQLWPPVGLNLGKVQMSNADGFGSSPMVAINKLSLRVNVIPIITQQKIEVGAITLDGLKLNLARTAEGKTNWDDLVQGESKPASPKTEESGGEFDPKSLKVGAIHITDAAVVWDDAGNKIQVSPMNLHTGEFSMGEAFDLALDLAVELDEPKMNVALDFKANVLPNIEAQKYSVSELSGTVTAKGDVIPNKEQSVALDADITADLTTDTLSVLLKKLSAAGVNASANVAVTALTKDPAYKGDLKLDEFNPKFVLSTLGIAAPETSDPEALKSLSLKTGFGGTTKKVELVGLAAKLDQSNLTGSFGVSNFETQALVFDLALDAIDVDRYLPPASDEEKQADSSKTGSAGNVNDIEIPADLAGQFNAKGKLKVGSVKAMNVKASDILFSMEAVKGRGLTDTISANLYEGSIKANHKVDVSSSTPKYQFGGGIDNVKMGPLLEAATGEPHVQGTTNLNFSLNSAGKTVGAVRKQLGGSLDFDIKDGAVQGFNLGEVLRKGRALRDGKTYTPSGPKSTDFAATTGTATIKNGRLTNPDLKAAMPAMRLVGDGWVDLASETLDYVAQPTIVETSKGQGGDDLDDLKNIPIPIRVKGAWADPKVRIEWDRLVKDAAKAKAKEAVEKEKDKLRKKAAEKLEKAIPGLGDLFRR